MCPLWLFLDHLILISVPLLPRSSLNILYYRWAGQGLEFLIHACEPKVLATLTDAEFMVSL